MDIINLKEGTKLMWDAKGEYTNGEKYHFIYPMTRGRKHKTNKNLVLVYSTGQSHYMSSPQSNLRLPTEEELSTLNWNE